MGINAVNIYVSGERQLLYTWPIAQPGFNEQEFTATLGSTVITQLGYILLISQFRPPRITAKQQKGREGNNQ